LQAIYREEGKNAGEGLIVVSDQINEQLSCKAAVDVMNGRQKSPSPTLQLHCYRST